MKRIIFIVTGVFLFIFSNTVNAQEIHTIKGKVRDVKTRKAIDGVVVTVLKNQKSILSNPDGSFELQIEKSNKKSEILHYSRIGYYDTIINQQFTNKEVLVRLRPKVYELEEVVVTAKHNRKKFQIGSYETSELITGTYKLSKGTSLGLYVKDKRKYRDAQLTAVSFYIGEQGKLGGKISLRILSTKHKVAPNTGKNINEMLEVLKEPVFCSVTKRGWNTVDLRKYNIELPSKGFFVYFTPILKKNQTVSDKLVLARYEIKRKKTPFYLSLNSKGIISYVNVLRFKKTRIPAVVLHYEK